MSQEESAVVDSVATGSDTREEESATQMEETTREDVDTAGATVDGDKGGDAGMDDLFGDDDDNAAAGDGGRGSDDEDEGDDDDDVTGSSPRRKRLDMDEEEEMYNRKFYGEDVDMSDTEQAEHEFKEANVELVKHIVPYKLVPDDAIGTNDIYVAKVPPFLMIDPAPFDPTSFEGKVADRLDGSLSKEDRLGDRLIDENTVRWRYSRDTNQSVFKESNTQIVQWSDGSYSLKLGNEYTDILINDTDNTFLTVSHDQQELMQCVEGGLVNKTLMFIPTSTSSKIHQKLSKAVARRNVMQSAGPGTYIVSVDPEIEKKELERKQGQIFKERRRRQLREKELAESPDTTIGGPRSGSAGSWHGTPRTARMVGRKSREDEYEEDDFLVDDDEDEDEFQDEEEEEDAEEEEEEEEEGAEEEERERANAQRLTEAKRNSDLMHKNDHDSAESPEKRRKVAVIDDEDDEDE
ncbi:Paf1-complex subunit LEO1 KNAG_0B04210 [Huiozyma naganishii CBS 8797]|uniref:Leo1-like protein n=1 Tax=Huiozyma naganishii (strain ATCC MYA-139 / BCRC 22969 / CBS 8797 / KCTC 17520 / NBRC 10181 / NCYC 3082 / Yp74L-3) TaxID=1071383 RepID=J7S4X2_HUIN7|nr:hypothetical protein KNAG_0B04210 [Kazachstania naganishii CBS 8797]CCK68856.1 hypothetical protein KNAG_0B04210 [Kazachstania naganishii CBS 8797]